MTLKMDSALLSVHRRKANLRVPSHAGVYIPMTHAESLMLMERSSVLMMLAVIHLRKED